MRIVVMGFMVAAIVLLSAPTEAQSARELVLASYICPRIKPNPMQFGFASWYGQELQGNPTANGEIYDMNGLTVAHRSLPFGTRLRITNLRNHRSLILRVNDRGPFSPRRIVDVSWAAAKKLGFMGSGIALVSAEVLGRPDERSRD
jgi:rare lipoprotein A (peptidoglycan hydrolase)